jgi:hypothetical protein
VTTSTPSGPGEPGQNATPGNGLLAAAYVPLTDIDTELGPHLLSALARARIAAYLGPTPGEVPGRLRLHVGAEERSDARTIVAAVLRAAGGNGAALSDVPRADPLDGVDTEAAFADLIADWHVDTVTAIREAERALSREDAEWRARLENSAAEPVWLDEHHYVPPPPPPLPRLAAPTIVAMSVLAVSILLLGLGGQFGLADRLTLVLGVGGLLLGAAMLIMRLRARHDEDDDGAVL